LSRRGNPCGPAGGGTLENFTINRLVPGERESTRIQRFTIEKQKRGAETAGRRRKIIRKPKKKMREKRSKGEKGEDIK